jgi:hypothetical protein
LVAAVQRRVLTPWTWPTPSSSSSQFIEVLILIALKFATFSSIQRGKYANILNVCKLQFVKYIVNGMSVAFFATLSAMEEWIMQYFRMMAVNIFLM